MPRRGKAVAEGQRLIWLPHTMAPFHAPPDRMAGSSTDCNGHNCVAAQRAAGPDGRLADRLQRSELRCSTTRRRTGWPARRQTATATTALQHNAPPARMAGSPTGCNGHDGVAAVKRRARDSNPQPISRHLISSQTASRSLTLRCLFTGSRFGRPRRLIFPGRNRDSWTITAVGFVPQVPGRSGITRAESIRRNRKRMASDGPPSVRSPVAHARNRRRQIKRECGGANALADLPQPVGHGIRITSVPQFQTVARPILAPHGRCVASA